LIEQKSLKFQKLPKNTRLIALEIWILIFYKNKNFEKTINNSFDFNKLDKRDKSFVYLLINSSMRRHKQAQRIYTKYAKQGIDPRNRYLNSILLIATVQLIWLEIAPYAVINEAVYQAKLFISEKQSRLVNAILRKISQNKREFSHIISNEASNLPEWLFNSWKSLYGKKNVDEIVKLAMDPPPLDIVMSTKITKKEKEIIKSDLNGVEIFPNVLRCPFNGNVEDLPRFKDGIWWIQDAASQIPCTILLTKIKKNFLKSIQSLKIIDMCCAPGGKTAQLLDNDLVIECVEKNKARSRIFKKNMARLNFNPNLINVNAEDFNPEYKADVILIDAPCSGTGTIRKNPDIFIRNAPNNLDNFVSIQNKILDNSAKILKKNGLIMYVTCSLQKIEGERRIENFLKSHKQFSIVSFKSEDFPKINDSITKEGFIRILPNHFNFNFENVSNGSDGFFIALLKKEK